MDNTNINAEDNQELDQVTLTLEDGSEIVCDIIAIFPCGEKDYIALLPNESDEDGDIFLYQFVQHGDDDVELIDIEDDDEFDRVSDAFDELLDEEEYDELVGDDEDDEVTE